MRAADLKRQLQPVVGDFDKRADAVVGGLVLEGVPKLIGQSFPQSNTRIISQKPPCLLDIGIGMSNITSLLVVMDDLDRRTADIL